MNSLDGSEMTFWHSYQFSWPIKSNVTAVSQAIRLLFVGFLPDRQFGVNGRSITQRSLGSRPWLVLFAWKITSTKPKAFLKDPGIPISIINRTSDTQEEEVFVKNIASSKSWLKTKYYFHLNRHNIASAVGHKSVYRLFISHWDGLKSLKCLQKKLNCLQKMSKVTVIYLEVSHPNR